MYIYIYTYIYTSSWKPSIRILWVFQNFQNRIIYLPLESAGLQERPGHRYPTHRAFWRHSRGGDDWMTKRKEIPCLKNEGIPKFETSYIFFGCCLGRCFSEFCTWISIGLPFLAFCWEVKSSKVQGNVWLKSGSWFVVWTSCRFDMFQFLYVFLDAVFGN